MSERFGGSYIVSVFRRKGDWSFWRSRRYGRWVREGWGDYAEF